MKIGWGVSIAVAIAAAALCSVARAQNGYPSLAGVRDGAKLQALLSKGSLTPEAKTKAVKLLTGYIGLWVEWKHTKGRVFIMEQFLPAKAATIDVLEAGRKTAPDYQVIYIELLQPPSRTVSKRSKKLLKQALEKLDTELVAAKGRFPDLARYDADHAKVTDESLTFFPEPPAAADKPAEPLLTVRSMQVDDFAGLGSKAPQPLGMYCHLRLAVTLVNKSANQDFIRFVQQAAKKAFSGIEAYELDIIEHTVGALSPGPFHR